MNRNDRLKTLYELTLLSILLILTILTLILTQSSTKEETTKIDFLEIREKNNKEKQEKIQATRIQNYQVNEEKVGQNNIKTEIETTIKQPSEEELWLSQRRKTHKDVIRKTINEQIERYAKIILQQNNPPWEIHIAPGDVWSTEMPNGIHVLQDNGNIHIVEYEKDKVRSIMLETESKEHKWLSELLGELK